jgi:ketosteroid isomerase-like protein
MMTSHPTTTKEKEMTAQSTETQTEAVAAADAALFKALLDRDLDALDRILADEFMIVDVASGDVHPRAAFLEALETGAVTFHSILAFTEEAVTRFAGADVGIVVGRTEMSISAAEAGSFEVGSRYTHVFQREDGEWHLLAAQGTRIE